MEVSAPEWDWSRQTSSQVINVRGETVFCVCKEVGKVMCQTAGSIMLGMKVNVLDAQKSKYMLGRAAEQRTQE